MVPDVAQTDIFLNATIFIVTLILTLRLFRKDGIWRLSHGAAAFRFFTVLSNVFCAAAALMMCFASSRPWVWTLKYMGTAAVTVTMLTVFVFLGPNMGYKKLLTGRELFMHLLTPLLAILSFFCFEKRAMTFETALTGILPLLLYSLLYLYKVLLAPEERRWEDFYGFNKGGKWPLSLTAMLTGGFIVCMVFMFLQNT